MTIGHPVKERDPSADAGGMGKAPRKRRRRRIVAILLAIIVVWLVTQTVVPARGPHGRLPDLSAVSSPSRVDGQLEQVVSVVAGRGAVVRCWSHGDWKQRAAEQARQSSGQVRHGPWSGYTSYRPVPTVHLSPELCIELTRLADLRVPVWDDESPDALALSVQALAHESVHVTGWLNEAMAQCLGMQAIQRAAVALGRTPKEGQYLAERYWTRWYRWSKKSYRSSECRNGRALDIRPQTDVWP